MNRFFSPAARGALASLAGAGLLLCLSAGPAFAGQDLCVSTKGFQRVQKGTATCSSTGGAGNVAIARGSGAEATAGLAPSDKRNKATASGDNSFAVAGIGVGNTATASGENSFAAAVVGASNTATASGDNSFAAAVVGAGNTATASGDNSSAVAVVGANNTATASGDNSSAVAGIGASNTATASSRLCEATAIGSGSTASC